MTEELELHDDIAMMFKIDLALKFSSNCFVILQKTDDVRSKSKHNPATSCDRKYYYGHVSNGHLAAIPNIKLGKSELDLNLKI